MRIRVKLSTRSLFRLKDDKTISTFKNSLYENNVAKLTIMETTEQTDGVYTCRASNEAGTAETRCQLIIQGSIVYIFRFNADVILSVVSLCIHFKHDYSINVTRLRFTIYTTTILLIMFVFLRRRTEDRGTRESIIANTSD